jgi:hypothetical protein
VALDFFNQHPIGILGIVLGIKFMPNYTSKDVDFDLKGFLIFAAASLLLSIALELFGDMQNTTPVLVFSFLGFLFSITITDMQNEMKVLFFL